MVRYGTVYRNFFPFGKVTVRYGSTVITVFTFRTVATVDLRFFNGRIFTTDGGISDKEVLSIDSGEQKYSFLVKQKTIVFCLNTILLPCFYLILGHKLIYIIVENCNYRRTVILRFSQKTRYVR